jgi:predicted component of type VI protein secretion system
MTTLDHAPRQVAVKVSPAGDKLITSGANYLHMSKKDLVEEAVRFYLDARREEMQAGMRELLRELDGSRASRVAMLAGMTREELDSVGGVEEDD